MLQNHQYKLIKEQDLSELDVIATNDENAISLLSAKAFMQFEKTEDLTSYYVMRSKIRDDGMLEKDGHIFNVRVI